MRRVSVRIKELEEIPSDIARKLIDPMFLQGYSAFVGALIFIILGFAGYACSGSGWYITGMIYTFTVWLWRFCQSRTYLRRRDDDMPAAWAMRNLYSGWATAFGWGLWSAIVAFEHEMGLVVILVGMHSGVITGAALRNSSVVTIVKGQIILACAPLIVACLLSPNAYVNVYAGCVVIYLIAALALTDRLHMDMLQLLLKEKEQSDLAGRLAIANNELAIANTNLEAMTVTDALTNIANRRAFDLIFAREWRRSARERTPLCVLIMDIDHFKLFNDFYGHQAGDVCLQKVAAAAAASMGRSTDLLARYGGEEFAVVLPRTDLNGGIQIAEDLLASINIRAIPHERSVFGYVTVSIGVACMVPTDQVTPDQLTAAADAALYTAKRTGRRRMHAATEDLVAQQPSEAA